MVLLLLACFFLVQAYLDESYIHCGSGLKPFEEHGQAAVVAHAKTVVAALDATRLCWTAADVGPLATKGTRVYLASADRTVRSDNAMLQIACCLARADRKMMGLRMNFKKQVVHL
eukprot:COSAG05_NODE_4025_length_1712_cov_2.835090_2_plen_115_part_00